VSRTTNIKNNTELRHLFSRGVYWQEIHWPRRIGLNDALQLLRHLAADRRNQLVVFEVRSDPCGSINFLVGSKQTYMPYLKQLIASHIEGTVVTSPTVKRKPVVMTRTIKLTSRARPLRVEHSTSTAKAILASMVETTQSDHLVLQIALGRRLLPQAVPTRTLETAIMPWWEMLTAAEGQKRIDREKRTAYRVKITSPGFRCAVRIGVAATTRSRQAELTMNMVSGIRTAEANGAFIKVRRTATKALNDPRSHVFWPTKLNIHELLGLSAWPLGDKAMPGLDRRSHRLLYVDSAVESGSRIIAKSAAPGDKRLLGLGIEDAMQHLHVLGPTGVGKSTLLLNLVCQDIAAGRGVVVIDPKGDLVNDVLKRVPSERRQDVVVLDPADKISPVGLNPLRNVGGNQDPEVTADHILAVFHGLYEDAWGPRTEDILHASLLTLASHANTSLLMLPLLLTNPGVRQMLIGHIRDPIALEPFWQWYERLSEAERQQAIAPVMNKLRAFLLRPQMRAVIGQVEPRFNISDIFSGQKILLVSLAKGLLGSETAALFGSLVVAQLRQATLARAALPRPARKPVTVFIDEFQDYMHLPADLADVLAQSRGLGVGLTLAHQHLNQLPVPMRTAVLANARSRVCFQLPVTDALLMAHTSELLTAEDFMTLGRYEVYASLVAGGRVYPFASGLTLPPPPRLNGGIKLRRLSQDLYGRSASEIDASIRDLTHFTAAHQPVGRRLRQTRQELP
jgi:hypothetical protein